VNNKFERLWKEAVVAYFTGTNPAFASRHWQNHEKRQPGEPVSGTLLEPGTL
jgi:hypothetical protein